MAPAEVRQSTWSGVIVLLVCAGIFGLLVVALVIAWVVLMVRTERLVRTAAVRLAAIPCPVCGMAIGTVSATAVAAAREEEMRKLFEQAREKGLRLRVDPHWRFPCPVCGAVLKFDPGEADGPRSPLTVAEPASFRRSEMQDWQR